MRHHTPHFYLDRSVLLAIALSVASPVLAAGETAKQSESAKSSMHAVPSSLLQEGCAQETDVSQGPAEPGQKRLVRQLDVFNLNPAIAHRLAYREFKKVTNCHANSKPAAGMIFEHGS